MKALFQWILSIFLWKFGIFRLWVTNLLVLDKELLLLLIRVKSDNYGIHQPIY